MQMQIISLVKHNFFKRSFRVTLDWQLRGVLHITLRIYQLISSSCYVLYALFVAYLPALPANLASSRLTAQLWRYYLYHHLCFYYGNYWNLSIYEFLSSPWEFFCLFVFVFCRVNRWTLILIYWTKGQECDDKKQIMLLYTICQQREVPGPRLMLKYHYVDANQTAKA